jgi:hypothetical protein
MGKHVITMNRFQCKEVGRAFTNAEAEAEAEAEAKKLQRELMQRPF